MAYIVILFLNMAKNNRATKGLHCMLRALASLHVSAQISNSSCKGDLMLNKSNFVPFNRPEKIWQ